MPALAAPHGEWVQTRDRSASDSLLAREYPTVVYAHAPSGTTVIFNEGQEPNRGGGGYLVHATDGDNRELGLIGELQTAREIDAEVMEDHP